MHADEKAIIEYLKSWPHNFVSGKEIARRAAGKARHEKEPGWAIPLLAQMVQRGVIESDHLGYFKLKPEDRRKKKAQRQVSPQLLKILKSSGKSFEGIEIDDEGHEPPA
jgi:hypothetical protein